LYYVLVIFLFSLLQPVIIWFIIVQLGIGMLFLNFLLVLLRQNGGYISSSSLFFFSLAFRLRTNYNICQNSKTQKYISTFYSMSYVITITY